MDEYITTTEAASRLGVTSARVRQLVLSGELPAQKFGPLNMVKVGDLDLVRNRRTVGRPKKDEAQAAAASALAVTSEPIKPRSAKSLTEAERKRIRDEQQRRWAGAQATKKGGKKAKS